MNFKDLNKTIDYLTYYLIKNTKKNVFGQIKNENKCFNKTKNTIVYR